MKKKISYWSIGSAWHDLPLLSSQGTPSAQHLPSSPSLLLLPDLLQDQSSINLSDLQLYICLTHSPTFGEPKYWVLGCYLHHDLRIRTHDTAIFWYLSLYKVPGLCSPTDFNFDFCFSHQFSRFPCPHSLRLDWKLRQWLVHVGAIPRSSLISSWSSPHSGFKSFYLYSWETCCYLF